MSGPSSKPPPRTTKPKTPAQGQRRQVVATLRPAPEAQQALAALIAELERLRESQSMLVAELSIRDGEARLAREALTKQEGDTAQTRRSWQQMHESIVDVRRRLADADIATLDARATSANVADALRAEIALRDARLTQLGQEFETARVALQSAEAQLGQMRIATDDFRQNADTHLALVGELRSSLQARSDELSKFSVDTSSRVAELVAAGLSQAQTVARLSSDLSSVRVDLIREVSTHAEVRRALETGEQSLSRLRSELDKSRLSAERNFAEMETLREQLWSLETDLSTTRQQGAQKDDRVSELEADIAQVGAARDLAAAEIVRLAQRVETDAAALKLLREDLDGANAMLLRLASVSAPAQMAMPSSEATVLSERVSAMPMLFRAGLESELATLRLDHVAREEQRWARERALEEARQRALTAEAAIAETRDSLAEREAMILRLANEIVLRDNEHADLRLDSEARAMELEEARQHLLAAEAAAVALQESLSERDSMVAKLAGEIIERDVDSALLEARVGALVREADAGRTDQGKLDRQLVAVSGSASYRWGLAIAAAARLWRRTARRIRRGRANRLFDFDWYLGHSPDVRWAGLDPYTHYLTHGRKEGRTPNRVFRPDWYLNVNPDVQAAGVEPLDHYLKFGAAEGRSPAPDFDLKAYLDRCPEAAAKGRHPLLHYLKSTLPGDALPSRRPRILMVAWHCPTRAHAGGLRMLDLYDQLRRLAPDARLDLFTVKKPSVDWAYDDLKTIFDNIYFTDHNDLSVKALNALRSDRSVYDVVDFQFLEAGHDVDSYRQVGRKLIFTPMELLTRAFHIERQTPGRIATAQRMNEQLDVTRQELALCRAVDEIVCVSRPDADFLRITTNLSSVIALETGVSSLEFGALQPAGDASRISKKVVFVAYFGSPTNVEALDWYLREVHPQVKARVPGYQLDVVGRGDLTKYLGLDDPAMNLVGEVKSVGPYIANAALGISPALSGAGFRGKINQYAILGLATVASPIAADGFAYCNGEDILIAGDAELFAESCVQLLTDLDLNRRLAAAAQRTCSDVYSWTAREGLIRAVYGIKRPRLAGAPIVTAIVPSYNHGRYIEERINSILTQSYPNIDLIVIDDKSPDDSDAIIRRLRDVHGFTYIRREQNTGTPFAAWAYAAEKVTGDFIWICESDDVAAPDFAATGVDKLCQDPSAVLFYCNSHVINEESRIVGSTAEYFRDIWQEPRWQQSFSAEGKSELANYQVRGMIVPNMSSALIRANAFRAAWRRDLLNFRLTGDWLFVGRVLTRGRAIFDVQPLSYFRKHAVTARERVKSAQSQAEFVMTKYRLHKLAGGRARDLAVTLKNDATRFIYEPASAWKILGAMNRISRIDTIRAGAALAWSMLFHRQYWSKFRSRVKDQRRAGQRQV